MSVKPTTSELIFPNILCKDLHKFCDFSVRLTFTGNLNCTLLNSLSTVMSYYYSYDDYYYHHFKIVELVQCLYGNPLTVDQDLCTFFDEVLQGFNVRLLNAMQSKIVII